LPHRADQAARGSPTGCVYQPGVKGTLIAAG